MERVDNLELRRKVLDSLSTAYEMSKPREGIHLSSLVYCLTKAYLDQQQTLPPTDTEVLLFATGYGLEEVLIKHIKSSESPVYEVDGIVYRPDFIISVNSELDSLGEIKSTRRGMNNHMANLPEKWITYQLAGCKMMGKTSYDLVTILLAERPAADLVCETLYYTAEEIESNWEYMLERRDVLKDALESNRIPTPYEYCEGWECRSCRYSLICETIMMSIGGSEVDDDNDYSEEEE